MTETLAEYDLEVQVYHCTNSACVLGSVKDPGRFTGGISAEQVNLRTGRPVEEMTRGVDYGEGFCPVCGEKGKPIEPNPDEGETGTHDFASGLRADPDQDIHDKVLAAVVDPDQPDVDVNNAQAVVDELFADRHPAPEPEVSNEPETVQDRLERIKNGEVLAPIAEEDDDAGE
jgi:hypothetical protein